MTRSNPIPTQPTFQCRLKLAILAILASSLLFSLAYLVFRNNVGYVAEWKAMKSWVATPARIMQCRLTETTVQNEHGPPSMVYHIQADYLYTYNGREYKSSRVAVMDVPSGAPKLRFFYKEIDQARATGKPVTCYVNPEHPDQAVLIRDLTYGTIRFAIELGLFLMFLGCIPIGTLIYSLVQMVHQRRTPGSTHPRH